MLRKILLHMFKAMSIVIFVMRMSNCLHKVSAGRLTAKKNLNETMEFPNLLEQRISEGVSDEKKCVYILYKLKFLMTKIL